MKISNGVMLNSYPDSMGSDLSDIITMLQLPEFENAFSLFYILPTFFNSDLDRGFSIIDYDINKELVKEEDLKSLDKLGIQLKFDIVLNHLSVASPQFKDLLQHGDNSKYKNFFINWNEFWEGHGKKNKEGIVIPNEEFMTKLFMRKSGLPILNVVFPDGSERPYWNTFYQKVSYQKLTSNDLRELEDLSADQVIEICKKVNAIIDRDSDLDILDLGKLSKYKNDVLKIINLNRNYLGQMDVNAKSPLVWEFYKEVLSKVKGYGCQILRLDAFAYLHKEVGKSNFFNNPGTWNHLSRINKIAQNSGLQLLPEIHAEYGAHLHDEVANEGYMFYDFFLPGLIIHSLEKGTNKALLKWGKEIINKGYQTVNMLGCHDGIPVLDLKRKTVNGVHHEGLLKDDEIKDLMNVILERGGRVKNLYGADGKKISYYQVNATYYSALGESDKKLLMARAIQLFMPGIPQIWYLDLFTGTNDYKAVERAGEGGHKEINRTNLSLSDIKERLKKEVVLKQLEMIKLRNTSKAFSGQVSFRNKTDRDLDIKWTHGDEYAHLVCDLMTLEFSIRYSTNGNEVKIEI